LGCQIPDPEAKKFINTIISSGKIEKGLPINIPLHPVFLFPNKNIKQSRI